MLFFVNVIMIRINAVHCEYFSKAPGTCVIQWDTALSVPSPKTLTVRMLLFRLQALESNPQQRAKYSQECDMVQMLGTLLENTAIPIAHSSLLYIQSRRKRINLESSSPGATVHFLRASSGRSYLVATQKIPFPCTDLEGTFNSLMIL